METDKVSEAGGTSEIENNLVPQEDGTAEMDPGTTSSPDLHCHQLKTGKQPFHPPREHEWKKKEQTGSKSLDVSFILSSTYCEHPHQSPWTDRTRVDKRYVSCGKM